LFKQRTDTLPQQNTTPFYRQLPFIVIGGCLIAMLTFGPRSAMGFFQLPLLEEKGWDRTTFGLAMALQNLFWGLSQPFFGAIADKYGTWRVMLVGALVYAGGLLIMSVSASQAWLYVGGGIMVGTGVGAGSFGIVLAAFARNVTPQQRSFVFGLGTAAGSAGMFLFAPLTQQLIDAYGWSDALVWLAMMMFAVPFLAIPLAGNAESGKISAQEFQQTAGEALNEAFVQKGYLLLMAGFFVCGFQVAFITAHFPAYISDIGLAAKWAVLAISMIGFFNIIGSLASGIIGQKYSKPYFLSFIYIARSVAITAFLLLPQSGLSVMVFSIVMGLLWLSTVAPTNGIVAVMFGTRHLGLLGGIVFLTHQIGSFLGVWMGGYLYEQFGSFDIVWWLGVALGLFAAIIHWPIKEIPIPRASKAV
jgi:MFS family permease